MSKAAILKLLSEHSSGFIVDPFVHFTVKEWYFNKSDVLHSITFEDLGPLLVVRSSVTVEDNSPDLAPGEFYTELDVPNSEAALTVAIDRVIESYQKHEAGSFQQELNEVIVQRQLYQPKLSGVLTSRDLTTGAPYYTIEYDDETGCTDTVTAGRAYKRIYIARNLLLFPTDPWDSIVKAACFIEKLLECNDLVIEFGVAQDGQVHIFQARYYFASTKVSQIHDAKLFAIIREAQSYVHSNPSTVWSDMTDWNPAEMLGDRPHPLDVSLYEFLVTNDTWAAARASLGYKDLRPRRLMETIGCKPYVNVRIAFQSLTPSALPAELAERLVDNRLSELRLHPELHDKVEIELLFTCADIAFPRRTHILRESGFSDSDTSRIEQALQSLTSSLLTTATTLFREDAMRRAALLSWREEHLLEVTSPINDIAAVGDYIHASLLNCKQLGVYSFARLARLAFIGRDLLGRLLATEACSPEWIESFWRSLQTIASMVAVSMNRVGAGQLSRESFNAQFGHLRPHTYDITSPRYDQMNLFPFIPEAYTGQELFSDMQHTTEVLRNISTSLAQAQIPIDAKQFLDFVRTAVAQRESSKFEFSAVLSDCLEAIAQIGRQIGITRSELSYLTVDDLLIAKQRSVTRHELSRKWIEKSSERRARWQLAEQLRLPSLIFEANDLIFVQHLASRPNFITSGIVEGDVVVIKSAGPCILDLSGKIVALEAADPGFDWLFSCGIRGLITRFGGAASHMAIRCAQFGIPAAIGCGEDIFRKVCLSARIRIDCVKNELSIIC